jgi:dienelactone hydrolase
VDRAPGGIEESAMNIRLALLGLPAAIQACTSAAAEVPWDMKALSKAPKTSPAPGFESAGLRALFFEGLPWKGKATKVFAWYGAPKVKPGQKVPAMVLVHGGLGTAFATWVKLWSQRGYAAIAMDTCGCVPRDGGSVHHDDGGPPGWDSSFGTVDDPVPDQWPYHAIADVILAHSLIRSFPEVDPDRIGITGISWGGYLTCIAAGVDPRFKLAVPVYGCGFLGENSAWGDAFKNMGPAKSSKWLKLWDPPAYLPGVAMPMLWVSGTNDFAYPMDSLQKSYRLPKGPRTICLSVRMPHGHGPAGENPKEIHVFADGLLKRGVPLARIVKQGVRGGMAWATYESSAPIVKAEMTFTKDEGVWLNRDWKTAPADVDATAKRVTAAVPAGAKVFYLNLFDDRDCAVSTEHGESKAEAAE